MLSGKQVQRKIVVGTFLGTNSARTILECGKTVVTRPMGATAAGTNFGIIYGFNDFLGTKFLDPTAPAERIMICFETLDSTERAGSAVFVLVVPGRQVRISVLLLGDFVLDCFHSYIHR